MANRLFPMFVLLSLLAGFFFSSSNGVVVSRSKKYLAGAKEYGSSAHNSSLVLAAERTHRRDPLNNYRHYTGGWNFREKHYWASVGFTAVPFLILALVWFAAFGLCLLLMFCCHFFCPHPPNGDPGNAYALSRVLLTLLIVAALVGGVVQYTGQVKFDRRTGKTLSYVVKQASKPVDDIRSVSRYLAAAKRIEVASVFWDPDFQARIDTIITKTNSTANTLAEETMKNSENIQDTLNSLRKCLTVIAAVMVLLTFLGSLFSMLGMRCLVSILVGTGWILVSGTFIVCGVFLLLHNLVGDTCVAVDEWIRYPAASTALDELLPCIDNAAASEALLKSKQVSSQLVVVVNTVITNLSNTNFPSIVGPPLYYNQSGPLIPKACNKFNPDLSDRTCATGEVDLNHAAEVWKNYVCQVPSGETCTTVGRLTPELYSQMSAAVNLSYGLFTYSPRLVQLADCSFVRETFEEITTKHCLDMKKNVQLIYTGLVMVSVAAMLSLIFWVVFAVHLHP